MDPETVTDPNNPILSRDLYEKILHYSTIPVLLFLIWLSWFLISRLMDPKRRQERRNREIRKAVAEREAMMGRDRENPAGPGEP